MEFKEIFEAAKQKTETKAKELEAIYKVPVTPFLFIENGEPIIGYLKEPARLDKMRAIDIYEVSKTQAGDHVLRTSLILDESDKRILEESSANDKIYLGAIDFVCKFVVWHAEQLKKKIDSAKLIVSNGEFSKREALIRYFFHEDPNKLSDEEFCIRWEQLKYCLKMDGKMK
jgi:hypothetical protein